MNVWAEHEPTVSECGLWRMDDTPVTLSRNVAIEVARQHHYDYVLMLDSDMAPDHHLKGPNAVPGAKPFLPTAWHFALNHPAPCIIGAPNCSAPPTEKVVVYRWEDREPFVDHGNLALEEYSREEAAQKTGIEQVAALATGLLLIDMRAIDAIEPPYFDYEWSDERKVKKVSTEDIFFTRDLAIAGVPNYVVWDAWAGHWKRRCVGKPMLINCGEVVPRLAKLIAKGVEPKAVIVENAPQTLTVAGNSPDGPKLDTISNDEARTLCDAFGVDPNTVTVLNPNGCVSITPPTEATTSEATQTSVPTPEHATVPAPKTERDAGNARTTHPKKNPFKQ